MIDIKKILHLASASTQSELSPAERKQALAILAYQRDILERAKTAQEPLVPSVQALSDYLTQCGKENSIPRMYANQMLEQAKLEWFVYADISEWIISINYVIQRAPEYNPDPDKQFFFPMSKLFVFFMYTLSGAALFRLREFNVLLTQVLNDWCSYLSSADSRSVLNPNQAVPATEGWLSPPAQAQFCLQQSVNYQYRNDPDKPYWNFSSFNDFFHREIELDTYRPLSGKGDDKVIVSANDGTVYRIARNVSACAEFWAKGQNYSLKDMFANSPYTDHFIGGDVMQSFLDGSDYHRWHAPISGKVIEKRLIPGLTFSELLSEGLDLSAGTLSQGYEANVNTRGLIIIQHPTLGKVAVFPVGITEISSIGFTVEEGQELKKGDLLGYFSYGGSTLVLAFEKGMIKEFIAQEPGTGDDGPAACKTVDNCQPQTGCLRVRGEIAIAN